MYFGRRWCEKHRRCSSVVEHVIGNDGVVSPILISGTINKKDTREGVFFIDTVSLAEADLRGRRKSGAEVAERIYARSAGSRDEA